MIKPKKKGEKKTTIHKTLFTSWNPATQKIDLDTIYTILLFYCCRFRFSFTFFSLSSHLYRSCSISSSQTILWKFMLAYKVTYPTYIHTHTCVRISNIYLYISLHRHHFSVCLVAIFFLFGLSCLSCWLTREHRVLYI